MHLEAFLSALLRMMLANYLGRKGRETCLKGVVVFSAGWDVFECTASLEKPLDRFLFNSYLTSCLQASVHRSARITSSKLLLVLYSLVVNYLVASYSDSPNRHRPVLEKCYDMDHVMKVGIISRILESSLSALSCSH